MSEDNLHSASEIHADEAPRSAGASPSQEHESRRLRRESARAARVSRIDPRTVLYGALALLVVFALLVAGDVAFSWDRIHPGVHVSGIDVGSLSAAQARTKLESAFAEASRAPLAVASGDETWKVTASGIGAAIDVTSSVNAAMSVGRTHGAWQMIADRATAVFGGVRLTATVTADADKLTALLDKIDNAIGVPSRDASVSIENGKAVFHASKAGDALDRDATSRAILAAFLTSDHKASAVIVPATVSVSDADARQAYVDAQKLVGGPVTVTYGEKSLAVGSATVATWIRFDRRPIQTGAADLSTAASSAPAAEATTQAAPARMTLVASFDATRVGDAISSLTDGLGVKPRNASFVVTGGKVTVKPSKAGRGPDLESLAKALAQACVSGTTRTAELKLVTMQPSLTTDAAREMGISDRISSYTTYYVASATSRVNNIHLLADAFNAKLVPPGGTFSFNGTAGQRTAEKGYQEAPAIVDGKLVPQLGGGVCQVGTTFFNAVFFAGLPVLERHNHSFYVSHYPMGRDATVSWGGPDFKFKNDTDGWILIRTSYTSGSLTISLYGTDPGYEVEYKTSKFLDVVPYKVSEIKDPKLKKGARVVESGGVNGGRVVVTRTVYKGGQVVREDTFVSRYTAVTQVVRVGTKVPSTPTTTTPTP